MPAVKVSLPKHLRKTARELMAAGGYVARDGNQVLIDGPPESADAVREDTEELVRWVIPSVDADQAELVRSLLVDAGASVEHRKSDAA